MAPKKNKRKAVEQAHPQIAPVDDEEAPDSTRRLKTMTDKQIQRTESMHQQNKELIESIYEEHREVDENPNMSQRRMNSERINSKGDNMLKADSLLSKAMDDGSGSMVRQ